MTDCKAYLLLLVGPGLPAPWRAALVLVDGMQQQQPLDAHHHYGCNLVQPGASQLRSCLSDLYIYSFTELQFSWQQVLPELGTGPAKNNVNGAQ